MVETSDRSGLLIRIAVAVAAVTFFVWNLGPQIDYDMWFDMKLGQYMWQTKSIPHHAMFLSSGERYSLPYFGNDEWGFCLWVWFVWCAGGNVGLAIAKAALLLAIFVVIYRTCRQQGMHPMASLLWVWIMVLMMRSRFALRPQLVTDLFLALLTGWLLRDDDPRLPWKVGLLFLLWGNLHPGVVGGLGLLTLWTLASGSRGTVRTRLVTLCVAWVSAMISPQNVYVFKHLYMLLGAHRHSQEMIVEWDPLTWGSLWGPFGIFVAVYLLCLGTTLVRQTFSPPRFIAAAAFMAMAVLHNRARGELAAVGALMAEPALQAWRVCLKRLHLRATVHPWRTTQAVAGAVIVACAAFLCFDLRRPDRFDLAPPRNVYPIGAIEELNRHPVDGTIFNTWHFGGYLAWRGFLPFIHGMNSEYEESLFDAYLAILGNDAERAALLDRFNIRACILAYPLGRDTHGQMIRWLSRNPQWHLVQWDDAGLLFVRGRVSTTPYVAVDPGLDDPIVTQDMEAAQKEAERALRDAPGSRVARLLLADVALREKRLEDALRICNALVEEAPDDYEALMKRGTTRYRMGDVAGALDDLRRAVRVSPTSARARYNLAVACVNAAAVAQASGRSPASQLQEATQNLREAIRLDPGFTAAQRLLDRLPNSE